ncbi:MAG TPA: anti-sigma regulatory factor [Trueperaceae bacterium]
MKVRRSDELAVRSADDIVRARQTVRSWAVEMRFSLVDQTKLVTAASELARNMHVYGGGGKLRLEMLENGNRQGLRMTFEDKGPGIADVELAMKDGYSTGEGMGLGLGGARRLVNEFELSSRVGEGTSVVATKWK